jgi:diaminopimelate epimerase
MKFTKMEGLGNDYIYVSAFDEDIEERELPALAKKISDRHFGVGSDGLVLIMGSDRADFRMKMLNSDGSEAEMCGNAIRCVAKYVYENRDEVNMRVWERGAGETMACGTGACAAVVAACLNNLTDRVAIVHLLGGDLTIEWDEESNRVFMTGPAKFVFEGEYNG